MSETLLQHRRTHPARVAAALVLALTVAGLPSRALAFSGVNIPGAAPPKLLHIEGRLVPEPPARGRFLSVRIGAATRYLAVERLRVVNSRETDLAVFDRLKPRSPNLDLHALDGKRTLDDRGLLGKDVVLEGYVRLEDRGPMLVTKLEPRSS